MQNEYGLFGEFVRAADGLPVRVTNALYRDWLWLCRNEGYRAPDAYLRSADLSQARNIGPIGLEIIRAWQSERGLPPPSSLAADLAMLQRSALAVGYA